MSNTLEGRIAGTLRDEAEDITARWVQRLVERLDVDGKDALPEDSILNHIPDVLAQVANYVEDPEGTLLSDLVRRDLASLADLRRSQGTSLTEVLDEFHLLSDMVDEAVARSVREYDGEIPPADLVRTVSRLKRAVNRLGTETTQRYRTWEARRSRDRIRLLEGYTDMLSHELANRLGAAETAVRLILGSGMDLSSDRVRSLHETILASIKSGLDTVQSVRALVGSEEDGKPGTSRTLPLGTIVRDAVHQMRIPAADRGIDIRLASTGTDALIDAERFPLAFFNLVTNAVRHHDTPNGNGEVVVAVEQTEAAVTITVEDDGPGIPSELRDTLFLPQIHGDGERGKGLGLAIARDAVRQMGGEIDFRLRSGRGTVFWIRIPRAEPGTDADEIQSRVPAHLG